jgi:pyruvate dehydrogenase E1 component
MPPGAEEGIVQGMHRIRTGVHKPNESVNGVKRERKSRTAPPARVQLLGSGTILREALAAGELLEREWNIAADVWSVTSFTELRRSGLAMERANRLNPSAAPQLSWVEQCLGRTGGPVIAATDYVRAVPDLIRAWVPRRYITLGTDGFGRSDTRAALRRFFEVDRLSIAFTAIRALIDEGSLPKAIAHEFMQRYGYESSTTPPWEDEVNLNAGAKTGITIGNVLPLA